MFADSPSGLRPEPAPARILVQQRRGHSAGLQGREDPFVFYIKDKLWKIYDAIPLRADGPLGDSYKVAVAKLNNLLGTPGRTRPSDPSEGIDRPTTDWQDAASHLRADDLSSEHLVGIVLEDKRTLANLASLRSNKPVGLLRHQSVDRGGHQGWRQRPERLEVLQERRRRRTLEGAAQGSALVRTRPGRVGDGRARPWSPAGANP